MTTSQAEKDRKRETEERIQFLPRKLRGRGKWANKCPLSLSLSSFGLFFSRNEEEEEGIAFLISYALPLSRSGEASFSDEGKFFIQRDFGEKKSIITVLTSTVTGVISFGVCPLLLCAELSAAKRTGNVFSPLQLSAREDSLDPLPPPPFCLLFPFGHNGAEGGGV